MDKGRGRGGGGCGAGRVGCEEEGEQGQAQGEAGRTDHALLHEPPEKRLMAVCTYLMLRVVHMRTLGQTQGV